MMAADLPEIEKARMSERVVVSTLKDDHLKTLP
jgi:hypothetical protein